MGDIDFDELDKAVSNLMGGAKTPPSQAQSADTTDPSEKSVKTVNIGDNPAATPQQIEEAAKKIGATPPPSSESAVKSVTLNSSAAPPQAPAVPPSPQQRPVGGRFMDVMHPSSDMKNLAPPPRVPSREELGSGKQSPDNAPAIGTVPSEPSSTVQQPQQTPVPMPAAQDMTSTPTVAPGQSPTAQPPATGATPESVPFSPFLPNAKVEKRPLGSASAPIGAVPSPFDDETKSSTIENSTETTLEVAEVTPNPAGMTSAPEMEQAEQEGVIEPIPINNEKMPDKGHVDDNQRTIDAADVANVPTSEEARLAQLESSEVQSAGPTPEESVRSVESGDTEKMKGGQPWQKPVATDQGSLENEKQPGIYDAETHQSTLKHPAKQKSGWLVVVAIVAIILVCAGLGVAAFFVLGPGL